MKSAKGLLFAAALLLLPTQALAWSYGGWDGGSSNYYYGGKTYSHSYTGYFDRYFGDKEPCNPVPEPHALALFGAGALVVGVALRKKGSRKA